MRIKSNRRKASGGFASLPSAILVVVGLGIFGFAWFIWKLAMASSVVAPNNNQNVMSHSAPPPRVLLTAPERGAGAFTDVRGNLGPGSVILENRTADWLKDRWQAASDMHGTAIKGSHWVRVTLGRVVRVQSFLLDWETAYAEDYRLEGWYHNKSAVTYFDSQQAEYQSLRSSHSFGQSPGVKQKLPLHIVHEIECPAQTTSTLVEELHLFIRKPFHGGWGVSLWRFQAFGYETT